MTSPNQDNSAEYPGQIPHLLPKHSKEIADKDTLKEFEDKIKLVVKNAGRLGLMDAKAFHSNFVDGERVKLGSEIIRKLPDRHSYLRVVLNWHSRTSFESDDGFIFTSEHVIGLSPDTSSINSQCGIIEIAGSSCMGDDMMPAHIWKGEDDKLGIFTGDDLLELPLPTTPLYGESLEVIKERIVYANQLNDALQEGKFFSEFTEDARYPY